MDEKKHGQALHFVLAGREMLSLSWRPSARVSDRMYLLRIAERATNQELGM